MDSADGLSGLDLPGFELPGYEVEQLLGFGSSGEVWRARERASGDLVALKRLRRIEAMDAAQGSASLPEPAQAVDAVPPLFSRQRLQREAALLASVRHEHVVRLRSVVPTDGGLVLVLDYAAGGSLASVLAARGTLAPGEVVTIGAPLAQTLADVQARGLTHGDVTPANILFDATGKPLLADLGVARLAGEVGGGGGSTPGYADPAAVAGRPATAASDVLGLAAVCYAALAGAPPFGGAPDRPPSLAQAAPGAPAALVRAIESALDPDPRARPDAAALARAMHAACAAQPVRLAKGSAERAAMISPPTHVASLQSDAAPEVAPAGGEDPGPDARRRLGVVARTRFANSAADRADRADRAGEARAGRHRPGATSEAEARREPSTRREPATWREPALARRVLVALVGLSLLGGAVLVGVEWASHDRSAAASDDPVASITAPASPATMASDAPAESAPSAGAVATAAAVAAGVEGDQQWARVLAALDAARDDAFVGGDVDELESVYTATSPALAADTRTLRRLVDAGEHAKGLALRLTFVGVRSKSASEMVLDVRDVLPDYDIVRANGTVTHESGRGERSWVVTLRSAGASGPWRIDRIDTVAAG